MRHLRAQCRTLEGLPGRLSPYLIRPRVSNCRCGLAVGHRAGMLRSRGGHLRHVSAPQDRYLFRTTSRLSPIGRAEDYPKEKPAKFAIEAAEAALHLERL